MMDFANKIIPLWTIIYDQDSDRIYVSTEFPKVLSSVDSSIRGYLGDEDAISDEICAKVRQVIVDLQQQCVIPIVIDRLQIAIYRWELDKTSKIHQLLAKCHAEIASGPLKQEISNLFTDIV